MDAGYSRTPQLKKLGVKPGIRLRIDGAPAGWTFTDEPQGVERVTGPASADVVIAFATSAADVMPRIEGAMEAIFPAGALWVAWPRKAAGHVSDVSENLIRETALERGLVDVKVAAIDTDWSGLKIVWRVENRTR